MQFLTFNSLLMFNIVFVFFLFLIGITCLVYYLPTGKTPSQKSLPSLPISQSKNMLPCQYHRSFNSLCCSSDFNNSQSKCEIFEMIKSPKDSRIDMNDHLHTFYRLQNCSNDNYNLNKPSTHHQLNYVKMMNYSKKQSPTYFNFNAQLFNAKTAYQKAVQNHKGTSLHSCFPAESLKKYKTNSMRKCARYSKSHNKNEYNQAFPMKSTMIKTHSCHIKTMLNETNVSPVSTV